MKIKYNIMDYSRAILIFLVILLLGGCQKSDQTSRKEPVNLEVPKPTQQAVPSVEPKEKVLIVTGEYVPYVSQSLEDGGLLTELIEQTLDHCDFEYEIEFYPWARCTEMLQSGEAWASYPFGHSATNDSMYLFSDNIYHTNHLFYYLKENDKLTEEFQGYDSIEDFSDYVFGGASGYWYGNRNDIAALGVKSEWANDTDALLKMLYAGRIDFFVEDELVCEESINRLFPEEADAFTTLPTEAKHQEYYLIVSKDYPKAEEYLEQFNSALDEIMNLENSDHE